MVKAYEATIPPTRRDTKEEGREGEGEGRRGTRSMRSSRSEIILRNARHRGRLIEIAEFFSQIFPLRVSDPAGKLVVCSLSLVVDRGGLH